MDVQTTPVSPPVEDDFASCVHRASQYARRLERDWRAYQQIDSVVNGGADQTILRMPLVVSGEDEELEFAEFDVGDYLLSAHSPEERERLASGLLGPWSNLICQQIEKWLEALVENGTKALNELRAARQQPVVATTEVHPAQTPSQA